MRVFQDVFTNDEYMSELFKHEFVFNNAILKAKAQYKFKDQIGQVDIGCGNAFGGEEEGGDGGEPQEKVLDIQFNFNLVETQFSKPEFVVYIKDFLGKTKKFLEENNNAARSLDFQKGASEFVKSIMPKFNDLVFYTGAKESLDGGIAISMWENDSDAGPCFFFFNDALKIVKF